MKWTVKLASGDTKKTGERGAGKGAAALVPVPGVGGGEKRGQYGGDGGENGATFQLEPFPLDRRFALERPGAVKGAPLLARGEANP